MNSTQIIVVDSREKLALPFPPFLVMLASRYPTKPKLTTFKLEKKVEKMPLGDYCWDGDREGVIIERKKNYKEVYKNCCTATGRRRFTDELKDLKSACRKPILLLETTPAESLAKNEKEVAGADEFIRLARDMKVDLWVWCGLGSQARQACAEVVARVLIGQGL